MESFNIIGKSEVGNPIAVFEVDKPMGVAYSKKFNNIDEAQDAPIVQKLFYLPFVKSVTLNNQSIQIERFNILEWKEVIDEVSDQIKNYLNSGDIILKSTHKEKKVPISIYAESTPNPNAMKFVVNKKLFNDVYEFKRVEDTKDAPLAKSLFTFPFIQEIFFDFNLLMRL